MNKQEIAKYIDNIIKGLERSPGLGCQCYAHGKCECACEDVNWEDDFIQDAKTDLVNLKNKMLNIKLCTECNGQGYHKVWLEKPDHFIQYPCEGCRSNALNRDK